MIAFLVIISVAALRSHHELPVGELSEMQYLMHVEGRCRCHRSIKRVDIQLQLLESKLSR